MNAQQTRRALRHPLPAQSMSKRCLSSDGDLCTAVQADKEPDTEQADCGPAPDTKRGRKVADSRPPRVAKEATYRLENGLRHVEPYDFDFTTHVKQRWLGHQLLEVFCREFVAYSEEYYRAAIDSGLVTVDGQRVSSTHVLCPNEKIVHRAVRCRENPVLDRGPIKIIADTTEFLVVDKPASLPIHPCGSYRYNCLVAVLKAQGAVDAKTTLHTTHRLDRLTSGVVILAKTKDAARKISTWFAQNEIRKTYLARVHGDAGHLFGVRSGQCASCIPEALEAKGKQVLEIPLAAEQSLPPGVLKTDEGRLKVEGYIRCICHKVGKHVFSADWPGDGGEPKESLTQFEYVGRASGVGGKEGEYVVRCLPLTGRTHQIRVHLRHLGLPIANDSCYGGELRNDPLLPLVPHVHHTVGGDSVVDDSTESIMHPSGIFLHAMTYSLPDGTKYVSEIPDWAESE